MALQGHLVDRIRMTRVDCFGAISSPIVAGNPLNQVGGTAGVSRVIRLFIAYWGVSEDTNGTRWVC